MRIHISAGHTLEGKGTGAIGYINESNENRILAKKIVALLQKQGNQVTYGEVNKSASYLKEQVALANKDKYDLVVQIHFNASENTLKPMGTEVLYLSDKGKEYAEKVVQSLGKAYKNRGVVKRDNLYWLKNTNSPAILIETCFVDSKADTDNYIMNKDVTALLIAEGITGKKINLDKPTEPSKPPTVKPVVPPVSTSKEIYQVIAGTYLEKEYAKTQVDKLAKLGVESYIKVEHR